MEQNKKIGSCQPKILSYKNRTTFEYAGAAGGYLDYLGYPYCRGRIFDTVELDKGQYDSPKEIFWSSRKVLIVIIIIPLLKARVDMTLASFLGLYQLLSQWLQMF